jgi:hypothetical protein
MSMRHDPAVLWIILAICAWAFLCAMAPAITG